MRMSRDGIAARPRGPLAAASALRSRALRRRAVRTCTTRRATTRSRRSDFFADGASARPLVEGTVARGHLDEDALLYTGKSTAAASTSSRSRSRGRTSTAGQERFNIYCSPCHGRTGDGNGMVVQRGYRQPPSYHIDRLRDAPVGHFFDVMTNGFGAMPDYRAQVPVRRPLGDRRLHPRPAAQPATRTMADVPPAERATLDRAGAARVGSAAMSGQAHTSGTLPRLPSAARRRAADRRRRRPGAGRRRVRPARQFLQSYLIGLLLLARPDARLDGGC